MDGVSCDALVDTGCTKSIAHVSMCSRWTRKDVCVTTVSGERYSCQGTSVVNVQLPSGVYAFVEVLVVSTRPLNFNFILGMNGVSAFRGVTVRTPSDVRFGVEECAMSSAVADVATDYVIDEKDFTVTYDVAAKKWTLSWKWCDGQEPPCLVNTTSEYQIRPEARQEYEHELSQWIADGWLVPHDEKHHGPVKGTIPLMAVVQRNKEKVRPVLDFRELNSHLSLHTAEADVCSEKIREWRRHGQKTALLDLRKAYLQIHVHPSLWPYQTVMFKGKRYCLTRLGFGLSIAPLVMKKVLNTTLSWDERIDRATSPYLDDILVDERIATAVDVGNHLCRHGLVCKPAEAVSEGARVLGVRVWGERNCLFWRRDNDVGEKLGKLTRPALFSLCG